MHKKSPADLVIFTEEILNGKLHFLFIDVCNISTLHSKSYCQSFTKFMSHLENPGKKAAGYPF